MAEKNPGTVTGSLGAAEDEDTVQQSGNPQKKPKQTTKKKKKSSLTVEEKLSKAKVQIAEEKAGKRKLFHSLVKLANELRRVRTEAAPLLFQRNYEEQPWYQGGIWRAPKLLPGVTNDDAQIYRRPISRRPAISLSSMFFSLVVVTALTRVGVMISQNGNVDISQTLYFAIFFSMWTKESSYATRFDTSDLSATAVTLVSCFAVLFATLSVPHPINSHESTFIFVCTAFVAGLHALLHLRVALTDFADQDSDDGDDLDANQSPPLSQNIAAYAVNNLILCTFEMIVYLAAVFFFDPEVEWRWILILVALLISIRLPRAYLANDFHAACSQRSVLFVLLLGFLLQSIVVVASEFFEYENPSVEEYLFLGAICLLLFCVKMLYVDDDSDTLTEDHALLINRTAGVCFNIGHFTLLLSTTVMGSGLNNMTHEYLAATAALPGPSKQMVCGGFAFALCSIVFLKSLHRRRVPTSQRFRALFIAAYVMQALLTLGVSSVAIYLAFASPTTGFLGYVMQSDVQLLIALSMAALVVVLMSWLDEGIELALYQSTEDAFEFRVNPTGFWCCLKPSEVDEGQDQLGESEDTNLIIGNDQKLSQLSPLLGSSLSDMKKFAYDSVPKSAV